MNGDRPELSLDPGTAKTKVYGRISNKYIFIFFRKVAIVSDEFMVKGSRFQIVGAATAKTHLHINVCPSFLYTESMYAGVVNKTIRGPVMSTYVHVHENVSTVQPELIHQLSSATGAAFGVFTDETEAKLLKCLRFPEFHGVSPGSGRET